MNEYFTTFTEDDQQLLDDLKAKKKAAKKEADEFKEYLKSQNLDTRFFEISETFDVKNEADKKTLFDILINDEDVKRVIKQKLGNGSVKTLI